MWSRNFSNHYSEAWKKEARRAVKRLMQRIHSRSLYDPAREEIEGFVAHLETHGSYWIRKLFCWKFIWLLIEERVIQFSGDDFAIPVCGICWKEFRIIEPVADPAPHTTLERTSDETVSCKCGFVHPLFYKERDVVGIQYGVVQGFLYPLLPGMNGKFITDARLENRPWPPKLTA
ncbi:MAG: hypothetical protein AAB420_02515 [Patescibacteria group bacterium]